MSRVDEIREELTASDYKLIRVFESAVLIMKDAGFLQRSHLPDHVWDVMESREKLREELRDLISVDNDREVL